MFQSKNVCFFLSQSALRLEFAMRLFGCDALIYLFFFKFFTSFLYFSSFVRTMLFVFFDSLATYFHNLTILLVWMCLNERQTKFPNFHRDTRDKSEIYASHMQFKYTILSNRFSEDDSWRRRHRRFLWRQRRQWWQRQWRLEDKGCRLHIYSSRGWCIQHSRKYE